VSSDRWTRTSTAGSPRRPILAGAASRQSRSGAREQPKTIETQDRAPHVPIEIVALLALVGYAVYRQTRQQEVVGSARFKLAIIYAIAGVVVGGFSRPHTLAEVLVLAVSLALSVVVGLARGRLTRLWAHEGRVYSQGTRLTIGLFLGLVAGKFAIGTACYFLQISDDGGFGEILLMIAVMIAFQAEIIWRRARALGAGASERTRGAT
jgi:hypothetical protein